MDFRVSQTFEKRTAFSNHGEFFADGTLQHRKSPASHVGAAEFFRSTPHANSL
jgi:hypothetical protein